MELILHSRLEIDQTTPPKILMVMFPYSDLGHQHHQQNKSKIYEDEKDLFQENAKATLYGSSDAVTALGYDEDTELLHVGTSAGRSDFPGTTQNK